MGIADRRKGLVPFRPPWIRFITGQTIRSRTAAFLLLMFLTSPAFGTEDVAPQGRPGVLRLGDFCFQGEISGPQLPCEDSTSDAEKIAGFEWAYKGTKDGSPRERADWEAWQASASSGAKTAQARSDAFLAELRKQGEQHADGSKPFINAGVLHISLMVSGYFRRP